MTKPWTRGNPFKRFISLFLCLMLVATSMPVAALDGTAPQFITGTPTTFGIGATTASIEVGMNTTGNVYYKVLPTDSTEVPNAADIMTDTPEQAARGSIQCASPDTIYYEEISGLTPDTQYYIYVMGNDGVDNTADIIRLSIVTKADTTEPGTATPDTTGIDTVAPEFVPGYPVAAAPMPTSIGAKIKINEDGTAYYGIVPNGEPAPTSEQLRDNPGMFMYQGSVPLVADYSNTFQINGLTPDTIYNVYITAEDIHGNLMAEPLLMPIPTPPESTEIQDIERGYPFVGYVSDSTVEISVMTTADGNVYYAIMDQSKITVEPTIPDIVDNIYNGGTFDFHGQFADGLQAHIEKFINVEGLAYDTNYMLYTVYVNSDGTVRRQVAKPFSIRDLKPRIFNYDITISPINPIETNHDGQFYADLDVIINTQGLDFAAEGITEADINVGIYSYSNSDIQVKPYDLIMPSDIGGVPNQITAKFTNLHGGTSYYAKADILGRSNSSSSFDITADANHVAITYMSPKITYKGNKELNLYMSGSNLSKLAGSTAYFKDAAGVIAAQGQVPADASDGYINFNIIASNQTNGLPMGYYNLSFDDPDWDASSMRAGSLYVTDKPILLGYTEPNSLGVGMQDFNLEIKGYNMNNLSADAIEVFIKNYNGDIIANADYIETSYEPYATGKYGEIKAHFSTALPNEPGNYTIEARYLDGNAFLLANDDVHFNVVESPGVYAVLPEKVTSSTSYNLQIKGFNLDISKSYRIELKNGELIAQTVVTPTDKYTLDFSLSFDSLLKSGYYNFEVYEADTNNPIGSAYGWQVQGAGLLLDIPVMPIVEQPYEDGWYASFDVFADATVDPFEYDPANVYAYMYNNNGLNFTGITTADGDLFKIHFGRVPAGNYHLNVNVDGESAQKDISVDAQGNVAVIYSKGFTAVKAGDDGAWLYFKGGHLELLAPGTVIELRDADGNAIASADSFQVYSNGSMIGAHFIAASGQLPAGQYNLYIQGAGWDEAISNRIEPITITESPFINNINPNYVGVSVSDYSITLQGANLSQLAGSSLKGRLIDTTTNEVFAVSSMVKVIDDWQMSVTFSTPTPATPARYKLELYQTADNSIIMGTEDKYIDTITWRYLYDLEPHTIGTFGNQQIIIKGWNMDDATEYTAQITKNGDSAIIQSMNLTYISPQKLSGVINGGLEQGMYNVSVYGKDPYGNNMFIFGSWFRVSGEVSGVSISAPERIVESYSPGTVKPYNSTFTVEASVASLEGIADSDINAWLYAHSEYGEIKAVNPVIDRTNNKVTFTFSGMKPDLYEIFVLIGEKSGKTLITVDSYENRPIIYKHGTNIINAKWRDFDIHINGWNLSQLNDAVFTLKNSAGKIVATSYGVEIGGDNSGNVNFEVIDEYLSSGLPTGAYTLDVQHDSWLKGYSDRYGVNSITVTSAPFINGYADPSMLGVGMTKYTIRFEGSNLDKLVATNLNVKLKDGATTLATSVKAEVVLYKGSTMGSGYILATFDSTVPLPSTETDLYAYIYNGAVPQAALAGSDKGIRVSLTKDPILLGVQPEVFSLGVNEFDLTIKGANFVPNQEYSAYISQYGTEVYPTSATAIALDANTIDMHLVFAEPLQAGEYDVYLDGVNYSASFKVQEPSFNIYGPSKVPVEIKQADGKYAAAFTVDLEMVGGLKIPDLTDPNQIYVKLHPTRTRGEVIVGTLTKIDDKTVQASFKAPAGYYEVEGFISGVRNWKDEILVDSYLSKPVILKADISSVPANEQYFAMTYWGYKLDSLEASKLALYNAAGTALVAKPNSIWCDGNQLEIQYKTVSQTGLTPGTYNLKLLTTTNTIDTTNTPVIVRVPALNAVTTPIIYKEVQRYWYAPGSSNNTISIRGANLKGLDPSMISVKLYDRYDKSWTAEADEISISNDGNTYGWINANFYDELPASESKFYAEVQYQGMIWASDIGIGSTYDDVMLNGNLQYDEQTKKLNVDFFGINFDAAKDYQVKLYNDRTNTEVEGYTVDSLECVNAENIHAVIGIPENLPAGNYTARLFYVMDDMGGIGWFNQGKMTVTYNPAEPFTESLVNGKYVLPKLEVYIDLPIEAIDVDNIIAGNEYDIWLYPNNAPSIKATVTRAADTKLNRMVATFTNLQVGNYELAVNIYGYKDFQDEVVVHSKNDSPVLTRANEWAIAAGLDRFNLGFDGYNLQKLNDATAIELINPTTNAVVAKATNWGANGDGSWIWMGFEAANRTSGIPAGSYRLKITDVDWVDNISGLRVANLQVKSDAFLTGSANPQVLGVGTRDYVVTFDSYNIGSTIPTVELKSGATTFRATSVKVIKAQYKGEPDKIVAQFTNVPLPAQAGELTAIVKAGTLVLPGSDKVRIALADWPTVYDMSISDTDNRPYLTDYTLTFKGWNLKADGQYKVVLWRETPNKPEAVAAEITTEVIDAQTMIANIHSEVPLKDAWYTIDVLNDRGEQIGGQGWDLTYSNNPINLLLPEEQIFETDNGVDGIGASFDVIIDLYESLDITSLDLSQINVAFNNKYSRAVNIKPVLEWAPDNRIIAHFNNVPAGYYTLSVWLDANGENWGDWKEFTVDSIHGGPVITGTGPWKQPAGEKVTDFHIRGYKLNTLGSTPSVQFIDESGEVVASSDVASLNIGEGYIDAKMIAVDQENGLPAGTVYPVLIDSDGAAYSDKNTIRSEAIEITASPYLTGKVIKDVLGVGISSYTIELYAYNVEGLDPADYEMSLVYEDGSTFAVSDTLEIVKDSKQETGEDLIIGHFSEVVPQDKLLKAIVRAKANSDTTVPYISDMNILTTSQQVIYGANPEVLRAGLFNYTLDFNGWNLNTAKKYTVKVFKEIRDGVNEPTTVTEVLNRTASNNSINYQFKVAAPLAKGWYLFEVWDGDDNVAGIWKQVTDNIPVVTNAEFTSEVVEGKESGKLVTINLTNGEFVGTISAAAFTLTGLPTGVTKGTVTKVDGNTVTIALVGNSIVDYDADKEITVTINQSQILPVMSEPQTAKFVIKAADEAVPVAPSVSFSFDGANAGKLVGSKIGMEYSITGLKGTYKPITADSMLLPLADLAAINENNDINVRVKATLRTPVGEAKLIDISRAKTPNMVAVDKENVIKNSSGDVVTLDTTMEFSTNNGTTWTRYAVSSTTQKSNLPDLRGTVTLKVRGAKTGTQLAGETVELKFSALNPALSIMATGDIVELGDSGVGENGKVITVKLANGDFIAAPTLVTVTGLPTGVAKGTVKRLDDHTLQIPLIGNSTVDYDADRKVTITVDKTNVIPAQPASLSADIYFKAIDEPKMATPENITFSFDGFSKLNANKLVGSKVGMEYSINGGVTYKPITIADMLIPSTDLALITAEKDILVRMKATLRRVASNPLVIDITKPTAPVLTADDEKNVIRNSTGDVATLDNTMEFSTNGTTWTRFNNNLPGLRGTLTLKIRETRCGTQLVGPAVDLRFTATTPGLSLVASGDMVELSENGKVITVTLTNGEFVAAPTLVTLTGLPTGVTKGTVTRVSDTVIQIALKGTDTVDFDTNKTVTITVDKTNVIPAQPVSLTTTIVFKAIDEPKTEMTTSDIISFSFDGEYKNKLMGSKVGMEYSINGGTTYKPITIKDMTIPATDLALIKADKDIKVRKKALGRQSASDPYVIDITMPGVPNLRADDQDNVIRNSSGDVATLSATMEFSTNGTTWTRFNNNLPTLDNINLRVREAKCGTQLVGPAVELKFSTLVASGDIVELSENGKAITVALQTGKFAPTVNPTYVTLTGLPTGVAKGTVTRISDTEISIALKGTDTVDFDVDRAVTITIGIANVTPAPKASLTTTIAFKAVVEPKVEMATSDIISFSFDGSDAGRLKGSRVGMEYSINGGVTYKPITIEHMLMPATDIALINDLKDILVRLKASGRQLASDPYVIDITKPNAPDLKVDDKLNVIMNSTGDIVTLDTTMEFRVGTSTTWVKYKVDPITEKSNLPSLTGNVTITVRYFRTAAKLASNPVILKFTTLQ